MDGGAIAEQIAAIQPRLFRFAWSLSRDPREAADLAQETVLIDDLDDNLGLVDRQANPAEQAMIVRAQLEDILAAFRSLPALYAPPLDLTAVEGLTHAETARILGIAIGTVMSRVHRGRRLLLARLVEGAP